METSFAPRACTWSPLLPLARSTSSRAQVPGQTASPASNCGSLRAGRRLSGRPCSRLAHTQELRRAAGDSGEARQRRDGVLCAACTVNAGSFRSRMHSTARNALEQSSSGTGRLYRCLRQRMATASELPHIRSDYQFHSQWHSSPIHRQGAPSLRFRGPRRWSGAPQANQGPGQPTSSGAPEGGQSEGPGPSLRVSFFEQKQKGSPLTPKQPVDGVTVDPQTAELDLGRVSDSLDLDRELELISELGARGSAGELAKGRPVGLAADGAFPEAEVLPAVTDLVTAMRQLDEALEADDLSTALGRLRGLNAPVLDTFATSTSASDFNSNSRNVTAAATSGANPRDGPWGAGNSTVYKTDDVRGLRPLGLFQERAAQVLDLALPEGDMAQVSRAYEWLGQVGVLRAFGRDKDALLTAEPRLVTPDILRKLSGLQASQLSPKKWGATNALGPLASIAAFSALVNNGVDVRPLALVLLVGGILDAVYLGGAAQAQVLSLWPGYRQRVLVHEAGHVLVAYLLGCPVRGVILDAFAAMDMGIQGQAGTQFWDSTFDLEMKANKLSGASIDRYSVVLFAGVAAEALVYGEAEGGESDENLFKALVGELQPPWPPAKISNQARWAVLQAYTLIRQNKKALDAVVAALKDGKKMGDVALAIESSVGA